jgi:hypothetical protein
VMTAPALSEIVLPVLAFDSDVRCWNAHRGHHEDWITYRYQVVDRIGAPASKQPLVPRVRLFRFLIRPTPVGFARLQANTQENKYTLPLALTVGECFALQLAQWRAACAPLAGKRPLSFNPRVGLVAAHKLEQARRNGDQEAAGHIIRGLEYVRATQEDEARMQRNDLRAVNRQKHRERL